MDQHGRAGSGLKHGWREFSKRIPAEVNLGIAQAEARIRTIHCGIQHLDASSGRCAGTPLPSENAFAHPLEPARRNQSRLHGLAEGLAKQRMIQQVMERIVTQTIPAIVVNNPDVDWNPSTNEVTSHGRQKDSRLPTDEAQRTSANRTPATRCCRKHFWRPRRLIRIRRPRPHSLLAALTKTEKSQKPG